MRIKYYIVNVHPWGKVYSMTPVCFIVFCLFVYLFVFFVFVFFISMILIYVITSDKG